MKRITTIILVFAFCIGTLYAQEENKKKDKPVRAPFESGILIDNQTVFIPVKNTLEFIIEHRFGDVSEGISDLWGIYAPSNIRLGLNYSVTNKLMVGVGTTKDNKLQDFRVKYNILEQTRKNIIPVAVTAYGNMAIDARNEDIFGVNYKFSNRLSYFAQVIIARKISNAFTVQIAPSWSHINAVDSNYKHDKWALSFAVRAKISGQSSIVLTYDLPLDIKGSYQTDNDDYKPKANFAIGWEISTSTHAFQIFIGTAKSLVPQYNVIYNQNDWTKISDLIFGFNITRLWSF